MMLLSIIQIKKLRFRLDLSKAKANAKAEKTD